MARHVGDTKNYRHHNWWWDSRIWSWGIIPITTLIPIWLYKLIIYHQPPYYLGYLGLLLIYNRELLDFTIHILYINVYISIPQCLYGWRACPTDILPGLVPLTTGLTQHVEPRVFFRGVPIWQVCVICGGSASSGGWCPLLRKKRWNPSITSV